MLASQNDTTSKSFPLRWKKKNTFKCSVQTDISSFTPLKTHLLHLYDAFDAADGGVEQRADSLVTVDAVGVPQAHEDDVRRKSRDKIDGDATRL